MKKWILTAALALMIPAMALAMTTADVIKLSQSGVGDEVVLSQIETSHQVFTLTVDDILELKNAGVSDRVITYMINTGKNQSEMGAGLDAAGSHAASSENAGTNEREYSSYHSDVDGYYRGYNDASFSLALSWGWGGYYYPSWYSYWPGYSYYYPSYWCGSYYSYPYYCYNDGYYDNNYRGYKDGRNISGRGGSHSGSNSSAYSANGRQYKGSNSAYSARGGRSIKQSGGNQSATVRGSQGGGRQGKSPTYGNHGGTTNRQAPAPTFSSPRSGAHSSPSRGSAPSTSSRGGGYGGGHSGGGHGGGGGGGGRTSKGR